MNSRLGQTGRGKSRKSGNSQTLKDIQAQKEYIRKLQKEKLEWRKKEDKLKNKINSVEESLKSLYMNSSDSQAFLAKLKKAVDRNNKEEIVFTRADGFIKNNLAK